MEIENKSSESTLPNGSSHQAKRGRGRPRGSLNKKFTTEKAPATHNSRPSKKVDFFSPEVVIKAKVKKRGRPKKIKMPGRPRKIPLTPEEETERLQKLSVQRKRKLSKPLGRPRIHPLPDGSKAKRGRGRPPKQGGSGGKQAGGDSVANGSPRKRGRPAGGLKKKRGRPSGSTSLARASDGTQKRRGRPPGSGNKVTKIQRSDGTPKRRGRPPSSGGTPKVKAVQLNPDGSPRKRGRPPGTGKSVKVIEKKVGDGSTKKRGRPPGTGKGKVQKAGGGGEGAPRRKRGRPSKVRLAVVLEKLPSSQDEDDDDEDAPSPKQSRTSDDSSQNPDDDDNRASDNDADPEDEDDEEETVIDCSKVNNMSENEMVGKFKKKK